VDNNSNDFLYFGEAIGRAIYLGDPKSVADYDAIASASFEITPQAIGKIATLFSKMAANQESFRSQQVRKVMIESLIDRFKMEASIRSGAPVTPKN
jgi:hypothetical protein